MGWLFPISSYDQSKWYENQASASFDRRFAIETEESRFIGISTLTRIDLKYHNASHGVLIGDKQVRGKGYGADAVMATMRFAFEELGLERLDGQIIESNEASMRLYTGLGWTAEGRRRHSVFRANRWFDSFVMGILREDYQRFVDQTKYWG